MSDEPKVNKIQSVALGVRDLRASERFYERIWGLRRVDASAGKAYFGAAGEDHHVVSLTEMTHPGLLEVRFGAPTRASVQALFDRAVSLGAEILRAPTELPRDEGGGFGFSLKSPDGQALVILSDGSGRSSTPAEDAPSKLSHVVFNSCDIDRMTNFFLDVLGFRLSDETEPMKFIRCAADHHSVALAKGSGPSVNHIAFEMPDIDALMSGVGRLRKEGYTLEWGVGRHGPGNNIFSYFIEPNGFVLEYTTGMQQINEATYKPETAAYWQAFPKRPCRWEMATRPSDRLIEAFSGKLAV
jgi:catechol 2,3-dioxygenase